MQSNPKGYPRPVLPRWDRDKQMAQNTPVPWVGGEFPKRGKWAAVDRIRALAAEEDKLCIVCGLRLSADFVYMLIDGETRSDHVGTWVNDTFTPSPTFVHPKCGQIASNFCPHLKNVQYPAMTQNGQKLTQDQLAELARESDKPE